MVGTAVRKPNKGMGMWLVTTLMGLAFTSTLYASETNDMQVGGNAEAVDIGTTKQLFLNQTLIQSYSGVVFTMNPPVRTGRIVLKADAPWEKAAQGHIGSYCSILKDKGKIRLWYDVRFGDTVQVAYAESSDGLHFTKPILGLHPLNGTTDNNIVMPTRIGGGSVWVDPRAPEDQRYRSQSKGYNSPTAGQLHWFTSGDGIHWTPWQTQDIGACDTQSIAFWDHRIQRYVLYTRQNPGAGTPARYRTVRRLESNDLRHWENEVTVMQADAVDNATYASPTPQPPVDYYGAAVFRYPDENGLYIMLSQTFWHFKRRTPLDMRNSDGKSLNIEGLAPATLDVRLAISRDGLAFDRLGARKPFMSLGPQGAFDSHFVWALPNPIRMGDELWVYYAGRNVDHDGFLDSMASHEMSGVGLAVMRLDGFVSADADYKGGEILTRAFTFEGSRLELNLDTGAGGGVRVELLDVTGQPIPGFSGDAAPWTVGRSVCVPIRWTGQQTLSSIQGEPIRIRITMRDCRLYAFQFVP
jgi:hypothetical protein